MEQNSEKVVLVHGVASHRSVMWPIAYRLWYDGFRAETWSYVNRIESTNEFEIGVLAAKYDFLVLFHFDSVTKPASSFRALSWKVSIHDRYNRRSIGAQRVPAHLLL
jgi:hypothetical protein